jgi:hypothetical protein
MSESTAPNVVPMIPDSEVIRAQAEQVKHYPNRENRTPLCGAPREEGNLARVWKKVTCSACEAAKGKPGRPAKDKDEETDQAQTEPAAKEATLIDDSQMEQWASTLAMVAAARACYHYRKAPPAVSDMVPVGRGIVACLEFYGMREQVDHPAVQLSVSIAMVGLAIASAPTIEDPKELNKAHGIEDSNSE